MNSFKRVAAIAATACVVALGASPASADSISNPTNSDSFLYLSGSLQGGQQTQFVGQTFTASITGTLTAFQFTLNSSTINSLYGAVYAWDGSKPTTLLWQSPVISGTGSGPNGGGLFDFSPTAANVTQGQTYVAFLSTYGIANNNGLATVCLLPVATPTLSPISAIWPGQCAQRRPCVDFSNFQGRHLLGDDRKPGPGPDGRRRASRFVDGPRWIACLAPPTSGGRVTLAARELQDRLRAVFCSVAALPLKLKT